MDSCTIVCAEYLIVLLQVSEPQPPITTEIASNLQAVTANERLFNQMPVRQQLNWREGNEGRYRLEASSSYRTSIMPHMRNRPVTGPACSQCVRGFGPFQACTQVHDQQGNLLFNGSCTNCMFGGQGVRCSFRESDLESYLIMANYLDSTPSPSPSARGRYRRFIRGFAKIAAPLSDLLREGDAEIRQPKHRSIIWNASGNAAFKDRSLFGTGPHSA